MEFSVFGSAAESLLLLVLFKISSLYLNFLFTCPASLRKLSENWNPVLFISVRCSLFNKLALILRCMRSEIVLGAEDSVDGLYQVSIDKRTEGLFIRTFIKLKMELVLWELAMV